jgi:hypothetical protein
LNTDSNVCECKDGYNTLELNGTSSFSCTISCDDDSTTYSALTNACTCKTAYAILGVNNDTWRCTAVCNETTTYLHQDEENNHCESNDGYDGVV